MAQQLPHEQLLLWLLADTGETTQHKAEMFCTQEQYEELLYIGVVRRVAMLNELLSNLTQFDMIGQFGHVAQIHLTRMVSRLEPFVRNLQNPRPILKHAELRVQAGLLSQLILEIGPNIWG